MIFEHPDYFQLQRNIHLPSVGTVPFKGIFVEFGREVDDRIKIRQIFYPKSEYSLPDVKRLEKTLENCPYCVEGKELVKNPFTIKEFSIPSYSPKLLSVDKEQLQGERKMPEYSITSWLDELTKNPRANTIWAANIISGLTGMPIGWAFNELGRRIAEGAIGIGGGVATNLIPNFSSKIPPRLKDELNVFFSRFVAAALDPTPAQTQELAKNFEQLKSALRFGRPEDWWASFGNPMDAITNAVKELGKVFGSTFGIPLPGATGSNLPASFSGREILEMGKVNLQVGGSIPTTKSKLDRVQFTFG